MPTDLWLRDVDETAPTRVTSNHPLPVKLPSVEETLLGVERLLTEQNRLLRQVVLGLSIQTGANLLDTE